MDRPLLETPDSVVVNDWSRDNRYILFQAQGRQQVARDLWALVPDGSGKTIQITSTPADETARPDLTGRALGHLSVKRIWDRSRGLRAVLS